MDPTSAPIYVTISNSGWDAPTVSTLVVSGMAFLAAVGSIVYARKMARNDNAAATTSARP